MRKIILPGGVPVAGLELIEYRFLVVEGWMEIVYTGEIDG